MVGAREPRVVGPGFHAKVFALVRRIPRGRVTTYGRIATLLGSPRVARHVGWALAAAGEDDEPLPWHRVVGAEGRIAGDEDRRGRRQRALLVAEGIGFDRRGRADLARHLWKPPKGSV